ncbi:MAG: SIMPL domain-containing protein [Anaerolineae bacterium]|nr:SIMPL domain-containing protein [Anaerolineae bacterium]
MSRKSLFVVALVTTLVLSGFVVALEGWSTVSPGRAAAQTPAPKAAAEPLRSITVIGEGKVSAKPDQAQIHLGVETIASTVQEASKENNEKMTAILAALKKLGIADKDIQTSNFSIYLERMPEREVLPSTGKATGEVNRYRVSNQMRVIVRDLNNVSTVIDQVVEAGANNVWGVNFTIGDPKALQSQARAAAVADAKAKAQELAKLNDVKVGQVISVSEVVGGPVFSAALSKAEGLGGGTPVEPGEMEFTLQLQIVYAIE